MQLNIEQSNAIHGIISRAEDSIRLETGLNVRLVLRTISTAGKTPDELLKIIATALDMQVPDYKNKVRTKRFVDLRKIAALMLRQYFPDVTFSEIAQTFDQDHTSVIHNVREARNLLDVQDPEFNRKYSLAVARVESWIKDI